MKKIYQYIALAAVALTVAACTQEEDFTPQGNLKDTPITIASAGVAELATRSGDTTPLVGTEDDPATISIFVTGGTEDDEDKYNVANMRWYNSGYYWTSLAADKFYEGVNSQQKIYAYSPYSETTATADGIIAVTVSDQTDWLVATEVPLTSNSVSFTMTHALAKLVLRPTYGSEVSETEQTIAKVELGGVYASGKLDIATNTWNECVTADASLTMIYNELLVIPMESCTSFPMVVTLSNGRVFKATVSLGKVNNRLAAGTQYNIPLQIGQDKVTLGGITAEPWNDFEGGELATE